jgi:hypothetical protein
LSPDGHCDVCWRPIVDDDVLLRIGRIDGRARLLFLHRDPRSADPLVTDATPADMAVLESRMKLGLPMSSDGKWAPDRRTCDRSDGRNNDDVGVADARQRLTSCKIGE